MINPIGNSKMINSETYLAIGLMSGTSMDGIDAALLKTDGMTAMPYGQPISYDYDTVFADKIKSVLGKSDRQNELVLNVEREITLKHAKAVLALLRVNDLSASDIDVIGFHGQTIFHDPDNAITIQIGDGDLLAQETAIDIVYDFRSDDVKNGGQGAPLLPVYHKALFAQKSVQNNDIKAPLMFLNIGGISNLTYIDDNDIIAFDCGPGNGMMNDLVQQVKNEPYDTDGFYASQGKIDMSQLADYMAHPYFSLSLPKSLDKNSFDLSAIMNSDISFEDKMSTLSAFCVNAIIQAIDLLPKTPTSIITYGGGVHNTHLMTHLKNQTQIDFISADQIGLSADFMEAECFAFMAVRHLKNLPNSFPETTGVNKPTIGGIYVAHDKQVDIKRA